MNSKLKIIFLGTPDYLNSVIQTLDKNFDLVKTIRSPQESLENLNQLNPDFFVIASFGKIIPQGILNIPKLGAINIHPSKLPLYRGPSPIQSQILDGVKYSAISFILMDSEMDHGPILKQIPFQISENDTFESLCKKMFAVSAEALPSVVKEFSEGKITPRLQDHATPLAGQAPLIASYCNLVKKEDGYFDIENPPEAEKLEKMIRAFYPWPGVWTKWKGKIVKFLPNNMVQMEGKNATDIKFFLNGYPDFPVEKVTV